MHGDDKLSRNDSYSVKCLSMIECKSVAKTYVVRERVGLLRPGRLRRIEALQGIDFKVAPGEFVGLLGPNGAGKTTLLKIIATLLLPTSGEVRVNGIDALRYPAKVRRLLGVVLAGERILYWKLTALENLMLFGGLYNMPRKEARQRADELLELVGLAHFANVTVEKFSTGMRRRLAIARALMHRPPILLLDEPTAGLDPHGVQEVWRVLQNLREQGTTVLMATHNMLEAERIPSRLILINEGRLIADGAPQRIIAQAGAGQVAVLTLDAKPQAANEFAVQPLDGGRWELVIPLARLPSVLLELQEDGVNVVGMEVKQTGLWEAFLKLTGRRFDDEQGEP